jgi:hypothetical protein
MLESFVSTILNRYLGQYVNNLDPDQLRLAVWQGTTHHVGHTQTDRAGEGEGVERGRERERERREPLLFKGHTES